MTWVGVPYRHQGRSKDTGVDCLGLLTLIGGKCGFTTYDTKDYDANPNPETMRLELKRHLLEIPSSDIRPADILHLNYFKGATHLALVGFDNTMIHAYNVSGKVVHHTIDKKWVKRIRAAYRIPQIDN